jgi:hypothetical protein
VDDSAKRDFIARKKCDGAEVLSTQADTFAGANVNEKASACSVRNDGGVVGWCEIYPAAWVKDLGAAS